MLFELHPQLAADTFTVGDLPLCRLLLINDSRYPWTILVPRRAGMREIYELNDLDRAQFWQESTVLSRALMAAFKGDKLNLAALGNLVPQLHVHHIVRFKGDDAWPAPVWGKHPPRPYTAAAMTQQIALLRSVLGPKITPPALA